MQIPQFVIGYRRQSSKFLKKKSLWTLRHTYLAVIIVIFAIVTRFFHLGNIKGYIFDEVYHAVTAKLIARGNPAAFEWWHSAPEPNTAIDWLHPPYAKYTQALGMRIFGENSFGRRVSAATFGVGVVIASMYLSWVVFKHPLTTLISGILVASDGLILVQSRIAMNDIHVTLMILLTLLAYWLFRVSRRRLPQKIFYLMSGVAAGLALGTKWSGLFVLLVIWGWEVLRLLQVPRQIRQANILRAVIILIFLPISLYLFSYWQMFAQGKTLVCTGREVATGSCYCNQQTSKWIEVAAGVAGGNLSSWKKLEQRGGCQRLISHFSELHHQIWWYQTNLKATHDYQSRPWQWFWNLKPVWMYVNYPPNQPRQNIYAQGNMVLFLAANINTLLIGLIMFLTTWKKLWWPKMIFKNLLITFSKNASIVYKLIIEIASWKWSQQSWLFIWIAYWCVWLPWQFSPRIMFFYHYTPAVPLMSIMLAAGLSLVKNVIFTIKFRNHRWLFSLKHLPIIVVSLVIINFIVFFPHWTGMDAVKIIQDNIYWAIPGWK